MVRFSKLRIESYYNTLPSGDIVSDSELDTFLCDEFFGEEFEFTVMDQSSVGGTTLRFSLTKKQAAQIAAGKDFRKAAAEQVGPRGQRLKKIATFNMGDKLQKVTETIEEISAKGLDMGDFTPSMSSKASGEKPESQGKKSGFLAVAESSKNSKSTKNITFALDEELENFGFDIPSPGGVSEAGSNINSPFRQYSNASPLGRRSPTKLRKFDLIPEPITEEIADEASEPSLHQSGIMKFQRGYSKESNKLTGVGINDSNKVLGDSDSKDIAERDITTSNPNHDTKDTSKANVATSSFPEIDAQLPILKLVNPVSSIVISEQDEDELARNSPNASTKTQHESGDGCSPTETVPTDSTRLEKVNLQSPPLRPPPRTSTRGSLEITLMPLAPSAMPNKEMKLASIDNLDRSDPHHEHSSMNPEKSMVLEEIDRKIQQAKSKTLDLENQLKHLKPESIDGISIIEGPKPVHSSSIIRYMESTRAVEEQPSPDMGSGGSELEQPESEDMIENSELIEQNSLLLEGVLERSAKADHSSQKIEQTELIEIHGDSSEEKIKDKRRNSAAQPNVALKPLLANLSLNSSPKLNPMPNLKLAKNPKLMAIAGSSQSIKLPKQANNSRSISKRAIGHEHSLGSHLADLASKMTKTQGFLPKNGNTKNLGSSTNIVKHPEYSSPQATRDLHEYGLSSTTAPSKRLPVQTSKPLSSILAKAGQLKSPAGVRPQKQSSPDRRPTTKAIPGKTKPPDDRLSVNAAIGSHAAILADRPDVDASSRAPRLTTKEFREIGGKLLPSPKGTTSQNLVLSSQELKMPSFPSATSIKPASMQVIKTLERKTIDPSSIQALSSALKGHTNLPASKTSSMLSQTMKTSSLLSRPAAAQKNTSSSKLKSGYDFKTDRNSQLFEKGLSSLMKPTGGI